MLFWKEILGFFKFFFKTPRQERSIVFYAEHESYFANFEGLIEVLTCRHGKTVSYITSDPSDPLLASKNPGIKVFYLSKLLPFFMLLVNSRVFVMTLTDLNRFYLRRSVNSVHYVYVFHSLVSTHMMYRHGSFDHYDTILCAGPHHVKEIREHEATHKLKQKNLVEAGYYRLERVYQAFRKYSPAQNSTKKGIVLIAPSWGDRNILESLGERLIQKLLDEGFEVIVRPHPETIRRSPALIAALSAKFDENSKFALEKSVATDDSLLKADVLICDCSGVALEYALGTERPVLFIKAPLKIRNKRFNETGIPPLEVALRSEIGVLVSPEMVDSIPQAISDLIEKRISYQKRLAKLREQTVYAFGSSSRIGAKEIIKLAT